MVEIAMRSIDEKEFWERFEEVVERAVRRARAEELKDIADAVKMLAEYMKTGFEKTFQIMLEHSRRFEEILGRIEKLSRRVEEHSKILEEHTKRLEELSRRIEEHSKVLEMHSRRLEELSMRIEEHSKVLEEHSKRLEELSRRIEEHSKRLEELSGRVEEHSKRLEEHSKVLETHSRRIEGLTKRVEELAKAVVEVKVAVRSTTRRLGLDLEKTVLNLYRDALLSLGIRDIDRVDKFVYKDIDGRYVGKGARVEVDIYMHNDNVYLVEVKSLIQEEDIDWINKKFEIVSQIIGRTPTRRIVVAINITREALERAKELNIDAVYGSVVE